MGGRRTVFLGTHTPRLDDKWRLILPAKFRDRLASGLVLTRGQERCLYVFPMDEFVRLAEAARTAPMTSKPVRDFQRVLLSGAFDEIPDKQGRVTVPAGSRVELWDTAAWGTYLESTEQAFSDQAEEVIPGLL